LITIIRIFFVFFLCFSTVLASYEKFDNWTYNIKFISKGCIYPIGEFSYKLNSPMKVSINGHTIIVPSGFITDLATIPRIFWSFDSPFDGKYMSAAILHDYLYSCSLAHNRKEADRILYSAMKAEGSSTWTANKFYIAVRIGGGSHYDPNKTC
jgi:hypothetical protein